MPPDFDLNGKSIWIAGETGMVGRAMARRLKNVECDILSAPRAGLDLTNQTQTYDWLAANKPDVIVMAAAKVGGIGANAAEPAAFLYENLAMAQNVIHGAYQAGVQKLLYLGSSCIYPKMAVQPITEDALLTGALEPTNEGYALAKIAGLKLCQFYRQQYGCDYIAAMPTNLYGTYDSFDVEKSHVIPALMMKIHQAKMMEEESVTLWGTGTPLREFLHVDDLADALVHLLGNYSEAWPINIGSGQEISIADLAMLLKNIIGYDGAIEFNPSKPNGTPRKLLDSSKINDLGWRAQTPLKRGLADVYEWYKHHVIASE
jgi:GDP-L-fucose synthase